MTGKAILSTHKTCASYPIPNGSLMEQVQEGNPEGTGYSRIHIKI